MECNTPILLIGFNRPDLFQKVLDRVMEVKPRRIYVGLDGARAGREDDKKNLNEIKRIVKNIKGCEVKTNYQPKNLGCKYGPVAAMNWFFDNEEMGIILEDDVLADKSFFYYCQELLEKFKDDKRVGSISGNNFVPDANFEGKSYLFSSYSQTWGWATWRRVWKDYDIEMKNWPKLRREKLLNKKFDNWFTVIYWRLIFDSMYKKINNGTWDYQFTFLNWQKNYLTIIPKFNLTKNIGIGHVNATHTKTKSKLSDISVEKMVLPLKHPKEVIANKYFDNKIQKNNYVLWKEVGLRIYRKILG